MSATNALLPDVRLLRGNGLGYRRIGQKLDISRHKARHLAAKAELANLRANGVAVVEIEPQTAAEYADRIAACWRRSREAFIEAGRLLCAAKASLDHGEFQTLVETLPFKIRKAEMLMAIYRDSRLVNPQYVAALPNELGTLYDLTRLNEGKFQAAITDGTIRPEMERKEVGSLLRGANGSRVGRGRRIEPDDSLDFYPTPPWATRALCWEVLPRLGVIDRGFGTVWEPACGEGHMAEVLREYASEVYASDIHDYGHGRAGWDFLSQNDPGADFSWIITNPPFSGKTDRALEFTLRALDLACAGIAMFVRSQWACEGQERYERLFRDRPPTLFAPFVERVPIHRGRWDPDGTSDMAYCWLVWVKISYGMIMPPKPPFWIPPGCRTSLTKPDDRERFAVWSIAKAESAE